MGDSTDRAAVRRNAWRLLLLLTALSLVGIVAGVLLNRGRPSRHSSHHPLAVTVVAVAVPILVVAVVGTLMVLLLRRSPSFGRILQYGWSERRAVFKEARSGQPLSRRAVQVADAQVDLLQRTGWVVWVQALAAALLLGTGLSGRTALGWFLVAVGGFNLALVPFQVWQRGRTVRLYRTALARSQPPTAER